MGNKNNLFAVIAHHKYRKGYLVGIWDKKAQASKEADKEEERHPGYHCDVLEVPKNEPMNMHNLDNPDCNFKVISKTESDFGDFRGLERRPKRGRG